ncbi:MAG: holo-ACP synthase [Bacillota bacterium]|nr:holo-ACP synthase [Bacillota bacterium]
MMLGIGTDLLEIERIRKSIQREAFLRRIFTGEEIRFASNKKRSVEIYAGTFSSKEAVSKALGTGFREFGFADIEILRDELGKPFVQLHNKAKERAEALGVKKIHLSISHTDTHCVAFCVMED